MIKQHSTTLKKRYYVSINLNYAHPPWPHPGFCHYPYPKGGAMDFFTFGIKNRRELVMPVFVVQWCLNVDLKKLTENSRHGAQTIEAGSPRSRIVLFQYCSCCPLKVSIS